MPGSGLDARGAGAAGAARTAAALLLVPLALSCLQGCAYLRGTAIPVWNELHAAPTQPARRLAVLLPGIGDEGDDFLANGFVEAIRSVDPAIDVVTVDAHVGYYVRGLLPERLHEDIVKSRRDQYDEVWLVGTSLGGLGAISYAARHPRYVDGVVLLAPFLGDEEVVDEVRAAGGVRSWVAPELDRFADPMRRLCLDAWTWVRDVTADGVEGPAVFLGYGAEDRFADAHVMLAAALPADRVLVDPGAHDWTTWTVVFDRLATLALARP